MRLTLALQPLDLACHELGFVRLVVGLHHHEVVATKTIGPELLFFARRVVANDRMRRVEDPLGRPIVLLELDHSRVRVIAFEVEDVAHVGAPPAEDRLVVVADDGEVLAVPGEVAEEHVLRTVGVLVLVHEDVLVAVLPALERAVGRLEQPAAEEQEVVEVDGVVLSKELVVPLPHDGRDPVELSLRAARQVSGAAKLVLGAGDDVRDRAWSEDLLAGVRLAHRLAQHRPLVGLVVDRERAFDPDERSFAAEESRAERVEGADRQLGEPLLADEAVEALAHLAGGLVRESHGQYGARRDGQIADQVGDPMRQHAGLSRTRAGEDQQRPVAVAHGGALLGIQRIEDRVGHASIVGIAAVC